MTEWYVGLTLAEGMTRAGLSWDQLWLDYVAIGGRAGLVEVEAYVAGALVPSNSHHDKIAVALNEAIHDRDPRAGYPVAYWFTGATDTRA